MSQQAVERTIGKLVTDESFRARFMADPARASFEAGLSLSGLELQALARIPDDALRHFAGALDDSIRRLAHSALAGCGRAS